MSELVFWVVLGCVLVVAIGLVAIFSDEPSGDPWFGDWLD
jgi:hypothetical protein